jgi:hypothetical protein
MLPRLARFNVVVVGMMAEVLAPALSVRSRGYWLALALQRRTLHPRLGQCENACIIPAYASEGEVKTGTALFAAIRA